MKNGIRLVVLYTMIAMVWSCQETTKKEGIAEKEIVKTTKVVANKNKQDEIVERLRNTTPVNADDLEAWLPKELGGIPLNFSQQKPIVFQNASVAMASYTDEESKKSVMLMILDTAGPEGSGYASKNSMYGRMKTDMEVEGMVMKSVSVKDIGAEQTYSQNKNITQLSFAKHERFTIKIVAGNFNIEETWNLVDELDFNALDKLIK